MVAEIDNLPFEGTVPLKGSSSLCGTRQSGETPIRDNRSDAVKSEKAQQILAFLHSIKSSSSDIPKEVRQEELGIECVLSNLTTDSQRAKDCILPSKMFETKQRARGQLLQTVEDDLSSIKTEKETPKIEKEDKQHPVVRRRSYSSQVIPAAKEVDADEQSVVSKWSQAGSIEALMDIMEPDEDDDPWRAAKRGDINALKRFHAKCKVDWAGEDNFRNIPLYYACHSGAIVDINVVSFLFKVTPIKDPRVLDRCRKNAINPDVVKIINGKQKVVERAPERAPDSSRDEPADDGSVGGFSLSGLFSPKEKQEKKKKYGRVPIGHAGSKDLADLPPMTGIRKVLSFDKSKRKEAKDREAPTTKENTKIGTSRASELPPRPKKLTRDAQLEKEKDEEKARDEKSKVHRPSRRRNSVTKQFLDSSVAGSSIPDDVADSWSLGSLSFMGRRKNKTDRDDEDKYSPLNSRTGAAKETGEDFSSPSRAKTSRSDIKKNQTRKAKGTPQTIQEDWSVVSDVTSHHADLESKSIKTSDSTIEDSTPEIKKSPSSQVQGRPTRKGEKNAPTVEFIEKEKKWVIANHTTSGTSKREKVLLTIHVFDPQQHVYIGNCHGVSIQIHGKRANAILIDSCSNVNVLFVSVVGTCEVVNSKKVAVETTGLCPTFALDKTHAITVWLSKESMKVSSFVTSKCTEVNISIPEGDGDDCARKEVPLPEQFVHKLHHGEVKSVASFENW